MEELNLMEIFKQRQLLHPSPQAGGGGGALSWQWLYWCWWAPDNDGGDEGHELEELDLGCFISPGSLFQLAASHQCLLDLPDMSSSHRPDLKPGRHRLEQLCIYCLLPFLSRRALSLQTSLLTLRLKYVRLNMTLGSPHGLYRSYLIFRGQICICLHQNFLQRQQDPELFIPPPANHSARAQCQIKLAYVLEFLMETVEKFNYSLKWFLDIYIKRPDEEMIVLMTFKFTFQETENSKQIFVLEENSASNSKIRRDP